MRKFLLKVILFILFYIVIQYLWVFYVSKQFPKIKPITDTFKKTERVLETEFETVLLGSSIDIHTKKNEKDKRSINQMLNDIVQNCEVVGISRAALNVGQFDEIIQYIIKNKREKPLFLIEVCLETFSNTFLKPSWQENLKLEEIVFRNNIQTAFVYPAIVFNYKPSIITEEEYLNTKIFQGDKYIGTQEEILNSMVSKNELIANMYLILYGQKLDYENEMVKELMKLIKVIRDEQVNTFFYITPVNYEMGNKYLPEFFLQNLNYNINFLEEIIKGADINYIDLSKGVRATNFNHLPWFPNGHLDQHGRMYVAKQLKEHISCR